MCLKCAKSRLLSICCHAVFPLIFRNRRANKAPIYNAIIIYGIYIPTLPKLKVNHPAQVIDRAMADNNDANITNMTPFLCHRIINVNPIQFNRAEAEQILAAYTPYVSEVKNNIAIPTNIIKIFAANTNLRNPVSNKLHSFDDSFTLL